MHISLCKRRAPEEDQIALQHHGIHGMFAIHGSDRTGEGCNRGQTHLAPMMLMALMRLHVDPFLNRWQTYGTRRTMLTFFRNCIESERA